MVPVVRFADGKSLTQIGSEVKEMAQKAKDKKLQPEDWEGNTFTISNLGMFGIDEFTQRDFNDLGYNIPSRNNMYMEWEATVELESEIDRLEKELNKYPVVRNEFEFRYVTQLSNQYNNLINQYNCILG